MMQVLKKLGFECIDFPFSSPDFASYDYFLFSNFKMSLKENNIFNDSSDNGKDQEYFGGRVKEILFTLHGSSLFPSWSGQERFSTSVQQSNNKSHH